MKMVGFKAAFRRGGLWEQDLEHPPGNPYRARIFADTDAELDGVSVGVPPSVGRKAEEHGRLDGVLLMFQDENRTGPSWCRVLRP